MKNSFFIATCVICFVCCPLFAATHTNEMRLASIAANEQTQSTDWKSIGEVVAYFNGSTDTENRRTFQLYTTGTGEVMYKIKTDSTEYIVAHNPLYNPDSNSSRSRFKYIAGNFYLNLGPNNTTEWNRIGDIAVYDQNASSKKTASLYIMKTDETMYKIRVGSKDYIVEHNPKYNPNGQYILN